MKNRWWIIILIGGISALCFCGICLLGMFFVMANNAPASTVSRGPGPAPVNVYGVGDTVMAGNWEYTVTKVEKSKTLLWSEFGNKTDAQGVFVVIYLTLKNRSKQNFSINSWDFELRDAGGVQYKTAKDMFMFVAYKKLTNLGDPFVPGLPVNTALVFDVNPSATGLHLYIDQARAAIDLGE